MGRKTSSAIPPKLTAKRSTQFHHYAMQRAVLLTQNALSSASSEVFFTLLHCRIPTIIGSLKTHTPRYSLHQCFSKSHLVYHIFFTLSIFRAEFYYYFIAFFCRKMQYKAIYTLPGEEKYNNLQEAYTMESNKSVAIYKLSPDNCAEIFLLLRGEPWTAQ